MNGYCVPTTDEEWNDIIEALQTFTRKMVKGKYWFRGNSTDVYLKGQEIDDYVYEGIGRFLKNPEKYDQAKGSLIEYLQYNIIRTLVSNDSNKAENKLASSLFQTAEMMTADEEDGCNYLDAMLPFANAYFDQQIDYDNIMEQLEETVKTDPDVEKLFYGFSLGMKRGEIIKEFQMSEGEYGNAYRRYNTVKRQIVTKFDLKEDKI